MKIFITLFLFFSSEFLLNDRIKIFNFMLLINDVDAIFYIFQNIHQSVSLAL